MFRIRRVGPRATDANLGVVFSVLTLNHFFVLFQNLAAAGLGLPGRPGFAGALGNAAAAGLPTVNAATAGHLSLQAAAAVAANQTAYATGALPAAA